MNKIHSFEIMYNVLKYGRLYYFKDNSAIRDLKEVKIYKDCGGIGIVIYVIIFFIPYYMYSIINMNLRHKKLLELIKEGYETFKNFEIFSEYKEKILKLGKKI